VLRRSVVSTSLLAACLPTKMSNDTSLECRLNRVDKTYRPGDRVAGTVTIRNASAPVSHSGLMLRATGVVRPHVESRGLGSSDSSSKSILLSETIIDMAPAGKLPADVPLPFEFTLAPLPGRSLTETYHGVYVSVKFSIAVTLARSGFMAKPLDVETEFVVEVPVRTARHLSDSPFPPLLLTTRSAALLPLPLLSQSTEKPPPAPVEFEIKPESLDNIKKGSLTTIPQFRVKGHLTRSNCSLNSPFTGEITVLESAAKIKSIEMQLVRVETIYAGGSEVSREATEIQNLQIGDGAVCINLAIPLYMIFPRVFTCPTVITDTFRVEFEVRNFPRRWVFDVPRSLSTPSHLHRSTSFASLTKGTW
jgi:Vacuolar protein sorting-associated protein 26